MVGDLGGMEPEGSGAKYINIVIIVNIIVIITSNNPLPNGASGPPGAMQLSWRDGVPLEVESPVEATADDGRW